MSFRPHSLGSDCLSKVGTRLRDKKLDSAEITRLEDIIEVAQTRGARDPHEYGSMLLSTSQFIMGHHDESVELKS